MEKVKNNKMYRKIKDQLYQNNKKNLNNKHKF